MKFLERYEELMYEGFDGDDYIRDIQDFDGDDTSDTIFRLQNKTDVMNLKDDLSVLFRLISYYKRGSAEKYEIEEKVKQLVSLYSIDVLAEFKNDPSFEKYEIAWKVVCNHAMKLIKIKYKKVMSLLKD